MSFNIYICGVGGQGIGLLAAVLAEAAARSGLEVRACDTHGLAQRGGVVSSHIRLGDDALTPLVPERGADLVLSLERLEALRGAAVYLKRGGRVIYYDAAWQPVSVRSGQAVYPTEEEVHLAVIGFGGKALSVRRSEDMDPRMQNAALLGFVASQGAIPGVAASTIEEVLKEMLPPAVLAENLKVFAASR